MPFEGGTARLHPLDEPAAELWSGVVSLPAVEAAVRVGPRLLALRGPDGRVYRYDPAEDAVTRIGELQGEARWEAGDDGGVWLRRGDGGALLLRVSAEGAGRRSVDRPVRWAGPAAGGATVAVVGSDPASLVRWPRGSDEPGRSLELPVGAPATVTAWGRVAALTRTDVEGTVQVVSLEDMAAVRRVEVGGPVTALATSPSSHQLYVGVDDPPRVLVVGRISGEVRTRARLEAPPREIRPGLAGGPALVRGGGAVHLLPWDGGDPVPIEGDWRSDLPLALPDGSVLVARDGRVERVRRTDGGGAESAPAGRVWVPVRWRAEAERTAPRGGATSGGAARSDTGAAAGVGGEPPDTAPRRPDSAATGPSGDGEPPGPSMDVRDPGFYVVLGWSGSPDGVRERLRPARRAGFPVAVQTRRDAEGERWYRALVGPYGTRGRAREVAGVLQREHSVDGWVQEVRPGLPEGTGR